MSVALASKGESTRALEHLRRAITLNPDNRALARQDPDLEACPGRGRLLGSARFVGRFGARPNRGSAGDSPPPRRPGRRQGNSDEVGRSKGLHPAAGLPLIEHVLRTAEGTQPASVVLIVGHRRTRSGGAQERAAYASPCRNPNSGPATRCSRPKQALTGATGTVVLLSGTSPSCAADAETLIRRHEESGSCRDGADRLNRRSDRVRPDRPSRRAHQGHRRAQGRDARTAGDPGNQQRHLRVRHGAVVRRAASDRVLQRPG